MLIHIQPLPRTALLLQLDGTLPNLALMRLAAHLRERNCDVHFKRMRTCTTLQDSLFAHWDDVYASAIFEKTRPLVEELKRVFPKAIVGGTGSGSASRLEEIGVSGFPFRAGLLAISEIRILNRLYSAGLPVTVSFLRSALEGR